MSLIAEQEVIAVMLTSPHLAKECDLSAGEFRHAVYQDIYGGMRALVDAGETFDFVTLAMHFEQSLPESESNHIWQAMKDLLDKAVGDKGMFAKYCLGIRESFRLTEISLIAKTLLREIQETKDAGAADRAITQLMALERTGKSYDWTMEQAVKAGLRQIEEAAEREGLVGIDTGIPLLNDATGGFNNSDLIVIGARPAMGKTALILNMANAAKVPAGIVSAEQGNEQIGKRMLSIEGSCDAQKIRTATLDDDFTNKLSMAARRLVNKKIWINDQPAINIVQLCRQVREWVHRYGAQIAYVDYIQKIKGSSSRMNPKESTAEVVSTLKNLAKELQIPIVALAQVNREVDKRTEQRPHMGDLSNAGEIEMEADLVIMLYRDEVYNEDTPDKGIAELLIEKNRHGPTGRIRTAWIGRYMQFKELTHGGYDQ